MAHFSWILNSTQTLAHITLSDVGHSLWQESPLQEVFSKYKLQEHLEGDLDLKDEVVSALKGDTQRDWVSYYSFSSNYYC